MNKKNLYIIKKKVNDMSNILRFEEFSNENHINEEWEFTKNIAKKLGLVDYSPNEIKKRALDIIESNKLGDLLDAIQNSTNSELHMSNFNNLKEMGGLPFYTFVLFLFKHINDLENRIPVYYNVDEFGVDRPEYGYNKI
jgi:hypothetical protein